jgi:N-carbamoylputrescine amidase
MRIALIQQHATSDRGKNLDRGLEAAERAAADGARLVAFAELAFTPFHPRRPSCGAPSLDLAEEVPGPSTEPFSALARQLGIVVVLNLYERDGDRAFDSSPVIDADGSLLGVTRMLHIAEMPGFHEQGYYAPGDRGMPVYRTAAGRLGVASCYDRHYPEVMRALGLQGAEIVIIPQAGAVGEWPDGLYEAEVRVASFQNGYFTALVNRVGREDPIEFAGESFVCDPSGKVVARAPLGEDHTLIADLDLADVARSHARRLFLRDRRPELYARLFGCPDHREDLS